MPFRTKEELIGLPVERIWFTENTDRIFEDRQQTTVLDTLL